MTTEARLQGMWREMEVGEPGPWVQPTHSRGLARREHGTTVSEAIDEACLKADGEDLRQEERLKMPRTRQNT